MCEPVFRSVEEGEAIVVDPLCSLVVLTIANQMIAEIFPCYLGVLFLAQSGILLLS